MNNSIQQRVYNLQQLISTVYIHCDRSSMQAADRHLQHQLLLCTIITHSGFICSQDRFVAVQKHQVVQAHLVLGMAEALCRGCSVDQAPVCPDGKVVRLPLVLVDVIFTSTMCQNLFQQVYTVTPAHALKVIHPLSAHQDSRLGIVRILHSAV